MPPKTICFGKHNKITTKKTNHPPLRKNNIYPSASTAAPLCSGSSRSDRRPAPVRTRKKRAVSILTVRRSHRPGRTKTRPFRRSSLLTDGKRSALKSFSSRKTIIPLACGLHPERCASGTNAGYRPEASSPYGASFPATAERLPPCLAFSGHFLADGQESSFPQVIKKTPEKRQTSGRHRKNTGNE